MNPTHRHLLTLLRSTARHHTAPSLSLSLQLHAHLLKSNLLSSPPFLSSLLSSYSHPHSLPLAHQLFDEIPHPTPLLFSSLLSPLIRSPSPHLALPFLPRLLSSSLDPHLLSSLASLSARLPSLPLAQQTHARSLTSPFPSDPIVASSLVSAYSKLRSPDIARKVFDAIPRPNPLSLTAMLSAYAANGRRADALDLLLNSVPADKNLLAWTAVISGFVQSGLAFDGCKLFLDMRRVGIEIDDGFVLSSVVSGSAGMAALELGKQLHCLVLVLGYESSVFIGNAVMDMYAKCSDIASARAVFKEISALDVVSWTTMIVGEAQHGRAELAFDLFDRMVAAGVKPNEVTFVGLIYACSHSGFVQKGRELFDLMVKDYKIRPSLQHYTCLLDLFSRSGLLSEALQLIETMPSEPDEASWAALLSACKKFGDAEMSIRVANQLLSLQLRDPSTYILLSNIYASLGKWDCVANVRRLMVDRKIKKEPGYSWIEIGKHSWWFYAGELPHHMSGEILRLIEELGVEMRKRGYVPDTSSVMHDLEENEKEQQLALHSERLAVAFGLLKSVPGMVIRVVKNLRVCSDCHTVLKLISSIVGREIVVRDANRFHHFEGGKCSCGDFW